MLKKYQTIEIGFENEDQMRKKSISYNKLKLEIILTKINVTRDLIVTARYRSIGLITNNSNEDC